MVLRITYSVCDEIELKYSETVYLDRRGRRSDPYTVHQTSLVRTVQG